MSQALELDNCDLNLDKNRSHHCTTLLGNNQLVVRRGMPFNIILHVKSTMHFSPESSKDLLKDKSFTAKLVPKGSPNNESNPLVTFPLHQLTDDTQWSAVSAAGPAENTIIVSITAPPDAPIGQYILTLQQPQNEISLGEFTLLFNPWCSKDTVYMSHEAERKEYVLETSGSIFRGTFKQIAMLPWNFGQDDSAVLDICFKILDVNPHFVESIKEDCLSRKDPVYVSRVLSAMINSNGDRGVLVGSWTKYPNGKEPWLWRDSAEILHEWNKSGPVRYGQCWVFAAVACTGIPCRVVTNFLSAHDSNANLSIEKLFRMNGDLIEGEDSIWNFHVWVECWMSRPDLGSDAGWQVVDPTPQETSDGVYCCGPAPVKAIKEGELTKDYDAPFIFAEVNADVVSWMVLPDDEKMKIYTTTAAVGRCISTKAVGSKERCDITDQYKYDEGSLEERRVYEKAKHHNKLEQKGEEPGLYIKIKLCKDMVIGTDFDVFAIVKNNFMQPKDVQCKVVFMASTVSYNGKLGSYCGVSVKEVDLPGGEETSIPLRIEYQQYASTISFERLINVRVVTMDFKNKEFKTAVKTIVLDGPEIDIKLMGEARVNQPMAVELTMLNTIPETLQDCCFIVHGSGLVAGSLEARIDPVGPKEEAKAKVELTPTTEATCTLVVKFKSDKLSNILNSVDIVPKSLPSED